MASVGLDRETTESMLFRKHTLDNAFLLKI